jgi:hypothetical protein
MQADLFSVGKNLSQNEFEIEGGENLFVPLNFRTKRALQITDI